jgi:hypothetical protein
MNITKHWESKLKNGIYGGLFPVTDPLEQDWFYAGDGWGSYFASMKLRRYSLSTGEELNTASIKNGSRFLTFHTDQKTLFTGTGNKIFKLDRDSLTILEKFDKKVQKYNDYCVSDDHNLLFLMNYRAGFLFTYNLDTKEGFRKKIGPCSEMIKVSDHELDIFNGFSGKIIRYDWLKKSATEIHDIGIVYKTMHYQNKAFLQPGFIESDSMNIWHIKPQNKIKIIDLSDLKKPAVEFSLNFDFNQFAVSGNLLYAWMNQKLYAVSLDTHILVSKTEVDKNEYIMSIFGEQKRILTENRKEETRTMSCYSFTAD